MQTRKYPRTMQEAFGPYTSHDIDAVNCCNQNCRQGRDCPHRKNMLADLALVVVGLAIFAFIGVLLAWRG